MHGDFSRWLFDAHTNDQGILQQQGRVLLDDDINQQTFFSVRWQQQAARDILGRGIAAVPEENPDSFQVTSARIDRQGAFVTVRPGHVWANGNLVYNESDEEWLAIRLGEVTDAGASGTRDAVVLETWLDAISGFQEERLLEPALGGPDTTERAHLVTALRLVRMSADEHCDAVAARLAGDPVGRLTVTLEPARTLGDPDCPIDDPGGYRGPEHHLYRIEMADVNEGAPRFKWSRFNGGLVGHGSFDADANKVHITANQRAIATAGLTTLYVEALAYDEDLRRWKVVYGGTGTLANDHEIDLTEHVYGEDLPVGDHVFIRIWDGIADVSAYPAAGAPLPDGHGIVVAFEEPGAPGDFWAFPVRAGWANPDTLIDSAPPHGIQRSFVPLAVLAWGAGDSVSIETNTIADCRRPIPPLTRREHCCTIRVGDGVVSRGDVTSLQDAIARLPPEGGTICLLPGEHVGAVIDTRKNITIHGCGAFSTIVPGDGQLAALQVVNSLGIRIHDVAIEAGLDAAGILVYSAGKQVESRDIEIQRLLVTAGRLSAIYIFGTSGLVIRDCDVAMADVAPAAGGLAWSGITVEATDACIERNRVRVIPTPRELTEQPLSHRVDPAALATSIHVGLGGIWLRGGSTRVRVIDNDIIGGMGHGVMLGHAVASAKAPADPSSPFVLWLGFPFGGDGPCAACADGGSWIPLPGANDPDGNAPPRLVPGKKLAEIEIRRNRIQKMGMAGIGVVGFFADPDMTGARSAIEIEGLTICENLIVGCLSRELQRIDDAARDQMGYGAIALARVADLLIASNRIEDNGAGAASAGCGTYVWQAIRAIVRDNVISGTGAELTATGGDPGPRGGVYIERATSDAPSVPALVVHANRVTAPSGHALRAIIKTGDAAVTCNQLASMSIGAGDAALAGSTVLLLDQRGATAEQLAQLAAYGAALRLVVATTTAAVMATPGTSGAPVIATPGTDTPTTGTPTGGSIRTNVGTAATLAGGRISFTDNRVVTSAAFVPKGTTAAITIAAEDVAFSDNQCLLRGTAGGWVTHAHITGGTLRVTGSRFEESDPAVQLSGVVIGRIATVALNQADHCLVGTGTPLVMSGNIERGEIDGASCKKVAEAIRRWQSADLI